MNGYFGVSKARKDSTHIPKLGEVFLYEYEIDKWDTRIGDGRTPAKDIPPLANNDIYQRVTMLEQEIERLKLLII